MPSIHVMSPTLASQVAAGEVVAVSYTHLDVYKRQAEKKRSRNGTD